MHFWKCKFASFQAEKEEEECNCAENEECYHGECIGKEGYFNPIDGNVAIWSVNIPLSISKNTNNASRINVSRSKRIVLFDVDIIVKKQIDSALSASRWVRNIVTTDDEYRCQYENRAR